MNDILYCIIHTQKQDDRIGNITNTWGMRQNIIFYSDHSIIEKNIYKVSDRTDYASGQEKQINVFNLINNKFLNYDWYCFCDNDTFVNTNLINQIVSNLDIDSIHGEKINHWPDDRSLYYLSGGAGFLVSRKLIEFLYEKLKYQNTQYGDVSFGLNLRDLNINICNNSLFHGMPPDFYQIPDDQIRNHCTFHYIKDLNSMDNLNKKV